MFLEQRFYLPHVTSGPQIRSFMWKKDKEEKCEPSLKGKKTLEAESVRLTGGGYLDNGFCTFGKLRHQWYCPVTRREVLNDAGKHIPRVEKPENNSSRRSEFRRPNSWSKRRGLVEGVK